MARHLLDYRQIVEDYKNGMSSRKIAQKHNSSASVINDIISRLRNTKEYRDIPYRNKPNLDHDKIAELYLQGYSIKQIAFELKTSYGSIATTLHRMRQSERHNLPYKRKPNYLVQRQNKNLDRLAQKISEGVANFWMEIHPDDLAKLQNAYNILTNRKPKTMNTQKNRKNRRARRAYKRAVANGTARKANRYFPGRPTASANPATKSKKTISLQELDADRIPDPILDRSRVENEIKSTNGNNPKEVAAPTIEEWEEIIAKARKQRKSIRTIAPKFGWILREDENPRLIDSWYK